MTSRQPRDKDFNMLVQNEVMSAGPNERVLFVDTDNAVREAVYPSEFHNGTLASVRERLQQEGVLKAVVHVSAAVLGNPSSRGIRTSVVEYLPDNRFYGIRWQANPAFWITPDSEALSRTQGLFNEGKENNPDP